jgi:hypothetical protein
MATCNPKPVGDYFNNNPLGSSFRCVSTTCDAVCCDQARFLYVPTSRLTEQSMRKRHGFRERTRSNIRSSSDEFTRRRNSRPRAITGTGPTGPTGAAVTVTGPTGATSTVTGPTGATSTVTGPTGAASTVTGPTGAASTVTGPTGAASTVTGPPGAASTLTGPTGAASTVMGPTGPTTPFVFSSGVVLSGAAVTSAAPILLGFGNNAVETINVGTGESTLPPEAGGFAFPIPSQRTFTTLTVSADLLATTAASINSIGLQYDFSVFVSAAPNLLGNDGTTIPYTTTLATAPVKFGFLAGTTVTPGTYRTSVNVVTITPPLVVSAGTRMGVRVRTLQSVDASAANVTSLSFSASLT